MPRESTEIARPCLSLYAKFHGSDGMLPSKMIPTTSPFLFTVGDPEFPPIMSAVETKLNGVFKFKLDFAFIQLSGRLYGDWLPCSAACSKAPPMFVANGMDFPF